jgi:hypothetical protein
MNFIILFELTRCCEGSGFDLPHVSVREPNQREGTEQHFTHESGWKNGLSENLSSSTE